MTVATGLDFMAFGLRVNQPLKPAAVEFRWERLG